MLACCGGRPRVFLFVFLVFAALMMIGVNTARKHPAILLPWDPKEPAECVVCEHCSIAVPKDSDFVGGGYEHIPT